MPSLKRISVEYFCMAIFILILSSIFFAEVTFVGRIISMAVDFFLLSIIFSAFNISNMTKEQKIFRIIGWISVGLIVGIIHDVGSVGFLGKLIMFLIFLFPVEVIAHQENKKTDNKAAP